MVPAAIPILALMKNSRSRSSNGGSSEVEQPLRGPRGVAGLAQLLEEHGELVAPQAGDRVRRAQAVREPLGDRDQETVAGAVPEAVVDGLEAVEVAEQHGDRGAGSLGAGD